MVILRLELMLFVGIPYYILNLFHLFFFCLLHTRCDL